MQKAEADCTNSHGRSVVADSAARLSVSRVSSRLLAREDQWVWPVVRTRQQTRAGDVKSQTAQSSHDGWPLPLDIPPGFHCLVEATDLGTHAPSRRLLSLLILPGRGEVIVLEATDGAADGK